MKTTKYFAYVRKRPDRSSSEKDWIKYVISHPEKTVIQSDGRIKNGHA